MFYTILNIISNKIKCSISYTVNITVTIIYTKTLVIYNAPYWEGIALLLRDARPPLPAPYGYGFVLIPITFYLHLYFIIWFSVQYKIYFILI